VRDVPHGGLRVIGDKTLKLLSVHIVDKGNCSGQALSFTGWTL
jgi:hypothetical protein